MKMAKRLLLGSAAGLVAVGGAQAADLPVKAAPVQYVKICTLYGEGFYYIPGSDTCIRFGGYVRADYGWQAIGARTPQYAGTSGARDRTVSTWATRHRANLQIDTRTQTAYGTLRTFTSLHFQNENASESFNTSRAFIQWAGFTFGRAQSFQDTWAINDSWHYLQQQNNSDTGANGINQIAYTWELGNGATFTLGADEPSRRKAIVDLSNLGAIQVGFEPVNYYAGERWPDMHADFKINQAWGYWATSFVVHDVWATYYSCVGQGGNTLPVVTTCGHPNDRFGWAIETGGEFKADFLNPGDRFGMNLRYAQGASQFGGGSNLSSPALFGTSNIPGTIGGLAVGWISDAVFVGGTQGAGGAGIVSATGACGGSVTAGFSPTGMPSLGTAGITCAPSQLELTTTWTVGAGYEHYWTPNLHTSITGAYTGVDYNSNAKAMWAQNTCGTAFFTPGGVQTGGSQGGFNNQNCLGTGGTPTAAFSGINFGAGTLSQHCDPDFGFFQGGVRTQWEPLRGLYMGIDVGFTYIFTAFKGAVATVQHVNLGASSGNINVVEPIIGARPNGLYAIKNMGTASAVFRVQRNFNAGD
jgi:hypothetical protein